MGWLEFFRNCWSHFFFLCCQSRNLRNNQVQRTSGSCDYVCVYGILLSVWGEKKIKCLNCMFFCKIRVETTQQFFLVAEKHHKFLSRTFFSSRICMCVYVCVLFTETFLIISYMYAPPCLIRCALVNHSRDHKLTHGAFSYRLYQTLTHLHYIPLQLSCCYRWFKGVRQRCTLHADLMWF